VSIAELIPVDDLLRELLKRAKAQEHPDIEFKSQLTVRSVSQKAEFAKDVALQANLPTGGNILYGFDNSGVPIGLSEPVSRDDLARVLANRLMFAPPGIEITRGTIQSPTNARVQIAWVRIPGNQFPTPTSFLGADGSWKMPIRVDTVTQYLTPVEAISHYRAKQKGSDAAALPPLAISFGSEPDQVPETLESNLFPFLKLPSTLWVAFSPRAGAV
jgi:hypothetical protein